MGWHKTLLTPSARILCWGVDTLPKGTMKTRRFVALTSMSALLLVAVCALQAQTNKTDAEQESQLIDLSNFYGKVVGTEGDSWFSHPDWKIVPKGLQDFDGVRFAVWGRLLLKSQNMPQLKEAVRNIPVQKTCRYIHLLHGVGYADEDGTPIAIMEILFFFNEKGHPRILHSSPTRHSSK